MPQLDAATLPLSGRQLIEASAGTGKTFNITRLYLRLLLERGLTVDRILVMTFTKAATQELRGRLGDLLRTALENWDHLDEPFFNALRDRIDPDVARARLHQALLHLDEAAVYTIHGFCKRVLTQQAFASGISFSAEMETDSRSLILEALQDWYRQTSGSPEFTELYQHWPTPEHFAQEWERLIASSDPLPEPDVVDPVPAWEAFRTGWSEEAEVFYALNVQSRKGENQAIWQGHLDRLTEWAGQPWSGQVPDLFSGDFVKQAFSTAKKKSGMPRLWQLTNALRDLGQQSKARLAWSGVQFAREHLAKDKDRLDQLDFNDLIVLLRQRLQGPTGDQLSNILVQQFPAALVDEFQDTDPDQYAILDALYRPSRNGESLLCMIGDPKQAIYGFRGGDVFAYLKARHGADAHWAMDTNYRSHPSVIEGYNRLFYGQPLPEPRTESPPETTAVFGFDIGYTPVKAGKPDLPGLDDPSDRHALQWGLLPRPEGQSKGFTKATITELADWSALEIQRLLAQVQWSGRRVRPGDIAVLVRDRNEAEVVQQSLREQGLASVYLSARDNVLQSPEATSLAQALKGILDLEDDRALVAALATPWFGFDTATLYELQQDEHAWARVQAEISDLRQRWLEQGLMSMALALFQRHVHPRPERHERTLTNSLHLLELLQQASQHHRQPWALMHWFDQAQQDEALAQEAQLRLESDADLIQVVTQHGAKGLEYPIVFLPFVSYGRSPRQTPMLVRYHDRSDFSARLALNPDESTLTWWAEEQAAEDIRLLYVAATRAELRLYLLAADFEQLRRSPLARCLKADSFSALTDAVDEQVREGTAGVLDLSTPFDTAPSLSDDTPRPKPERAQFTGRIERDWWLSSFSALTRNARHGGLSNPDRDQDEPDAESAARDPLPLRFSLARGAESGNLLHDLLERLDFTQPDFKAALNSAHKRYPNLMAPLDQPDIQLTAWIRDILAAELPSGARLGDLPWDQTLRETEFYFPMQASGMTEPGRHTLSDILSRHRNGEAAYLPEPRRLKGMMHGYIDLIYHWQGRYYVVDYKSSHLGDALNAYSDAALTDSVRGSYYDLQYLIYALALHRFLQVRLPDYQPDRHLGGVHYLYLRGMAPGQSTGIYHRPMDLDALNALDRLFEGQSEVAS